MEAGAALQPFESVHGRISLLCSDQQYRFGTVAPSASAPVREHTHTTGCCSHVMRHADDGIHSRRCQVYDACTHASLHVCRVKHLAGCTATRTQSFGTGRSTGWCLLCAIMQLHAV